MVAAPLLIQDIKSKRWFTFNDERVLPMQESELQDACGANGVDLRSPCAYMLLYRKRGGSFSSSSA